MCVYSENFHTNKANLINTIDDITDEFVKNHKNISCCIIEPIQCTAGDLYIDFNFLKKTRLLTEKYKIPLIFDEIQTGFYTSSKIWYFQVCNVIPDILIFGKKSQVSGIAINKKYAKISEKSLMLDTTYNSDHLDMIRCSMIMNYIESNNILKSEIKFLITYIKRLSKFDFIYNLRSDGSLFAFELKNKYTRDNVFNYLYKYGVLTNISSKKTIRLRLNLLISMSECNFFIDALLKSYEKSKKVKIISSEKMYQKY